MEVFQHDIDCYDIPPEKTDDKIYINAKDMLNMIAGQLTAYDVDEVIGQLKEAQDKECVGTVPKIRMCDAIEIVRSGMKG